MKARLGEKMSSSSLSYKDISILDASVIQMAVSTVSNSLPLPTESFLVCRSLINRHPWLSEKYDEEWLIPALLQPTLQNRKATLQHHKLTKSKSSIFYTSFCVYILMKTKPLDAHTSSVHERGS